MDLTNLPQLDQLRPYQWEGIKQMAVTAKNFCTDDKLKQWGFWQAGQKHARDSIRHGCYFLLFFRKGQDIIK